MQHDKEVASYTGDPTLSLFIVSLARVCSFVKWHYCLLMCIAGISTWAAVIHCML